MKSFYLSGTFIFFLLLNSLKSQCTFTVNTPYSESFAGVTNLNQLPTCWAASNLGNTCLTYTSSNTNGRVPRTGTQFASFYASPVGANFFYTNGIQLNAGITYSISVWYTTEYFGYTNWSDLSILLGTSQNSVSLISLASTNGPAVSNIYKLVSATFSVATSGVYYSAIRATSSSASGAQYLTIDDFLIQATCANLNINFVSSSSVVCSGTSVPISFTATSANTNSWSTGATGTITTYTANLSSGGTFTIVGTNTLSGCSSTASIVLSSNPSPYIGIWPSTGSVCSGQTVTLTTFGANNYTWSNGQQTNSITVNPSITTSYSVLGTNNSGCASSASQAITVFTLPVLSIQSSLPSNTICVGNQNTLSVSGALSYNWTYGQNTENGNQITVSPSVTTNYVVVGTDANDCVSQASFVLNVKTCTGINQLSQSQNQILLSPNPFQHEFLVSSGNYDLKKIIITDLSGRILLEIDTREDKLMVNTKDYSNGIYYVKVISFDQSSLFKMIKN